MMLQFKETLLRGIIWAFVGAIYGLLFVILNEYLREFTPTALRILLASIGAAALTALFYGSMRLVVIVANVVFIGTLIYIALTTFKASLESLVLLGSTLGFVTGMLYGWGEPGSHIFRADGKILAGLFSGTLAMPLLLIPALWFDEIPYPWSVVVLTPLVVLIYVSVAYWFVDRCCNLLPPIGDGALVGLGVGGVTGMLFMIMAGQLSPELLGLERHIPFISRIHAEAPVAMLGAACSSFVTGIGRGLLQVRWYDL